jgi:Ca2+-binding EF-hand superfamily protein
MKPGELNYILDDLSVLISHDILANNAMRASFQMISDWYSTKGFQNSAWIELLDLKKWIAVPDWSAKDGDVPVEGEDTEDEEYEYEQGDEDDEDDDDDDDDDEDANDEDEGRQYSLSSGHSLVISENDTAHVLAVATYSGLSEMDPETVVRLLSKFSRNGVVTRMEFLNFFNALTNDLDLENKLRNQVLVDLFTIYSTFEEYNPKRVVGADFRCLAVGLTVLCAGNKSAKLEVGIKVFEEEDESGEYRLSRESLSLFLASYLLVFAAMKVIKDDGVAIDTAMSLSQTICERLNEYITFTTFGNWYNSEGYSCAPWIELLGLAKWEKLTGYTIKERKQFYEQQDLDEETTQEEEEEEEEEEEGSDEQDEEDYSEEFYSDNSAFNIILFSRDFDRKIAVSRECASQVFNYSRKFKSANCSFDRTVSGLERIAQQGLVHRRDFLKTMHALGYSVGESLHGKDSFILKFFDAFDRSQAGYCDIYDIVIGLVLLDHSSNKSEKLVYAFDYIDDNASGVLSKREIWKFFRSFLISVVVLAVPNVQISDHLNILADESAVWLVESLLAFVAKHSSRPNETPASIAFDDIADWYMQEGCKTSAWIELLDLKKWVNKASL